MNETCAFWWQCIRFASINEREALCLSSLNLLVFLMFYWLNHHVAFRSLLHLRYLWAALTSSLKRLTRSSADMRQSFVFTSNRRKLLAFTIAAWQINKMVQFFLILFEIFSVLYPSVRTTYIVEYLRHFFVTRAGKLLAPPAARVSIIRHHEHRMQFAYLRAVQGGQISGDYGTFSPLSS